MFKPPHRTKVSQGFSSIVLALGAMVMVSSVANWDCPDPVRYSIVLVLANLSAGWKIGSPAFPGTISVGTLFVLLGFVGFTLPETVLIGVSSTLTQFLLHERAPWRGLAFRLANISVAVTSAHFTYQACLNGGVSGTVWPIIPAALVFALLNTFAAAVQQALSRKGAVTEVWHECGFWTLPFYLLGAGTAAGLSWVGGEFGRTAELITIPVMLLIYRFAQQHLDGLRARRAGTEQMASHQQRTLETLSLAIAARFRAANDQLSRTQTYSMALAEDLNFSEDEREALRVASVMHDVGTLAVPEQILGKAGRLTPEEFERIKVHPVVGAEIIERAEFPYPVSQTVRYHHERWDGQGYPEGLFGTKIPRTARVLAAVDCLVSLTTDRPHRRAIGFDRAIAFVSSQAGMAFDPEVVEAIQKRSEEFGEMTASQQPLPEPDDHPFVTSISKARRESQEIYSLAQHLGASLEVSETLETIDQHIPAMIPFDALAVFLVRDEVLIPEYVSGAGRSTIFSARIELDRETSGAAARTGKPVRNGNPDADLGAHHATGLNSALAVPLEGAEGTIGVVTLYRRQRDAFSEYDQRVLLGVQNILSAAIENALRFEKAEASATTDNLTGLPNARSLFQRVETEVARCRRSNGTFSVIVCDLNGFKHVNDRFGHLSGNHVLQKVGSALQHNCREYDYVARLGGDEFVILLPGLPDSALQVRLQHLTRVVAVAAEEAVPGCGVTLSAGSGRYPDDGTDGESLLATADARMYEHKRGNQVGGGGYVFDLSTSTRR